MRASALFIAGFFACAHQPTARVLRPVASYPTSLDAGASVSECRDLVPNLPKPLSDDDVLARFVDLPATRHSRKCSERDFHPCDPVGPHDCDAPSWEKTWSSPLRRKDLVLFQRYWTILGQQCRFIGEVRVVESRCQPPRDEASEGEQSIEAPDLPKMVDLVTGEPLPGEATTAVGSANKWR